jgi:hypothetical protein
LEASVCGVWGVVAAAERLEDVVADEGYELTLDP